MLLGITERNALGSIVNKECHVSDQPKTEHGEKHHQDRTRKGHQSPSIFASADIEKIKCARGAGWREHHEIVARTGPPEGKKTKRQCGQKQSGQSRRTRNSIPCTPPEIDAKPN